METVIKSLTTQKGIKSYRLALFLAVVYVADKITDLDKRVAVIESRIHDRADGPPRTNDLAAAAAPLDPLP